VTWRGVAWDGAAWRGVGWRGVAWRGVFRATSSYLQLQEAANSVKF